MAVPILGLGLPLLGSELKLSAGANTAVSLSGLAVALVLPAITHWLNDDVSRAWRALLGLPASTIVGAFLGLIIGAAVAPKATDADDDPRFRSAVIGGAIGATAACAAWIVYDVLETGANRRRRSAAAHGGMHVGASAQRGGALLALSGAF